MSLREKLEDRNAYMNFEGYSDKKPTLDYKKFDLEKLVLVLMGDEHIGSRYYNRDEHKKQLDWIYEKHQKEGNVKIILMGDELETATKNSVGAGVYEQNEILDKQVDTYFKTYKPFADEGIILGQHEGNHELRIYKDAGLNITKLITKDLVIDYLGWGKLHYFKVGDEGYTLYTTHGSSGARLPHTKIKGALDLSKMAEAEIYAMGHLHQLSHHIRNYYGIDKRSRTIQESQKHFLLTGSYLDHWGSYAHIKSYEPMRKGSPRVRLDGKEHKINVSI